ncbi:MAG: Uma2 family endonuclease [Nevskia sp.]|nr:Uma2 family endonuclease [Nevskia sp.]
MSAALPLVPLVRHKFSVEDYHRMGDAGVFAPGCRVELLHGEIINMTPIGSLHLRAVNSLSMFFAQGVGARLIVSTQNPISLPPDNEPQPDIVILQARADGYGESLPAADDVLLLIEVADSSVDSDRQVKVPLYASHGIPEVWLFDLKARRLEIYTKPKGRSYANQRQLGSRDSVKPTLFEVPDLHLGQIWPAS